MNTIRQRFLDALRAALSDKKVEWEEEIPVSDWGELFHLAQIHNVLPMIFEAVYSCPAARNADQQLFKSVKKQTIRQVMLQTIKTNEFLRLYTYLRERGITPLVVKGLVCRGLYPQPDHRQSGDEDVLIPAEQFTVCHQAMEAYGMHLLDPERNIDAEYEVPYGKPDSPLYIELHKSLFSPDSEAFGEFNRFFESAFDRMVEVTEQGMNVLSMGYTDHLFYLICHAFKHFLHSGFGIRQVCDIVMFANTFGSEIDWLQVLEQCRQIRADKFVAALFRIGRKYLNFDAAGACYPKEWRSIRVDEMPMLEDLLSGGIYGASDMSRKHSSNITLNEVSARKNGKRAGNSVLKTVFPSVKNMKRRYPYLEKHPYLLPVAWADRIVGYRREIAGSAGNGNSAADAVRIGNERIELLKRYGIIEK